MTLDLVEKHVLVFAKAYSSPPRFDADAEEGGSPAQWFAEVKGSEHGLNCKELARTTNRAQLLAMSAEKETGIDVLCVSVLAWGGMHRANRDRLFERSAAPWLAVARRIRSGSLSRRAAFDEFANLRADKKEKAMLGMGPAYFTKLIYFLMPETPDKGYILDQWAGLSMNMIAGVNVVKMDETVTWKADGKTVERTVNSRVSDVNTGEDYDRFCRGLESLSARMGGAWTPGQVERALMSQGGRTPQMWRSHVVAERLRTLPPLS
ncbi:hypothetical protein AB9E19_10760 [Rhizobium leguminosarum]|uniref:8-oxoguanine DNA glycosylase OGG fold protein n=1 Tax=Rhizobium leguminosarum TaxID=384 RepID=UPI003F94DF4C